MACMQLRRIT